MNLKIFWNDTTKSPTEYFEVASVEEDGPYFCIYLKNGSELNIPLKMIASVKKEIVREPEPEE